LGLFNTSGEFQMLAKKLGKASKMGRGGVFSFAKKNYAGPGVTERAGFP